MERREKNFDSLILDTLLACGQKFKESMNSMKRSKNLKWCHWKQCNPEIAIFTYSFRLNRLQVLKIKEL